MARSDGLEEKPGVVARWILRRHDQCPLPAIDHDKRITLRRFRLAAAARRSEVRGCLGQLLGAEAAAALQVLPALPARRAELAGEIKALDMVGAFATLAAIVLGDQRRQRDWGALAFGCPVENGPDVPSREGGVETRRAVVLPARAEIIEPGDGFPLQRCGPARVEESNQPGIEEPGGADATAALGPDEQLKPASAILGGGERRRVRRGHGDVAAITPAGIEDAEATPLSGAEIA